MTGSMIRVNGLALSLVPVACAYVLGGWMITDLVPPTSRPPATSGALAVPEEGKHLNNVRQLTFGGQNAEAYFSLDDKYLIFQHQGEGVPCDQIYTILVNTPDGQPATPKLVSTGKGRTTCGYFLGDNQHILYASTHEAAEACPPSADRSKGYVWAVYPGYDIFLATVDGKIVKKLTDAPGYDAEATVNWKTGKIVYPSMPSTYTRSCRFSN